MAPEQWGSHTASVVQPRDRAVHGPDDLAADLGSERRFMGSGEDQLTVVFGDVHPWEQAQMEEWLLAIFPDLQNPAALVEAIAEWDSEEPVLARFPERLRKVLCVRVAVPAAGDGGPINDWAFGRVMVLGRALVVFWYGMQQAELCARIDACARRGQYSGEPPESPVAHLADAYVTEVVREVDRCAGEAIKEVDEWEMKLFDSLEQAVPADAGSERIAELGSLKLWAVGLRQNVDEIRGQINPGQFRARWSSDDLEPVAAEVGEELDLAAATVARLRSDVAGAFEASTSVAIAHQLAASKEQQERADRFEGTVTRLTAFLLVPTLVAAVFGANVELPGSGWLRTAIMVGAMVAGAVATFAILGRLGRSG
ncbi:MAG TPA: CorA family divalent cation transporter [Solirubrobacterales bacterium]|nr:CorA family divalent cation transporter [Solirubrobacterales bacterium]